MKTIVIKDETKKILDEIKVHPRETYNEVIMRLIEKKKFVKIAKDL